MPQDRTGQDRTCFPAVGSSPLRAERRRRKARREIFTTPELDTARQSILGPPAEGRPGPSFKKRLNGASVKADFWHGDNIKHAWRRRKSRNSDFNWGSIHG